MKEILESLRSDLAVRELAETFRKKTDAMVPGNWKVVGIQLVAQGVPILQGGEELGSPVSYLCS